MTSVVPPGVCLSHGPFAGDYCPTCFTGAAAVSATSTEGDTSRPPTAIQLATAADILRRYAATADLNDTDRSNLRVVADDLGLAALALGASL